MNYLYAFLPILLVLLLMLIFRRGSHEAGLAGWLCGILIAALAFGLDWQVFWVSQVKGLFLTLNVLAVLWPALLLYHLVDQAGGVHAIALALQEMIPETGWLLIIQAWMLSAFVENLAGFGLPIAIVAPMLILMGVKPVRAVAASAIGHCWAVSLGSMALAYRTMTDITGIDAAAVFPNAALFLGVSVLLTGLAVAMVLGQMRYWRRIVLMSVIVAGVQFLIGWSGMIPLSSFTASIIGILAGFVLVKTVPGHKRSVVNTPQLKAGLLSYGFLFASIVIITLVRPLNQWLAQVQVFSVFPQVSTTTGLVIPAGKGFVFKPFVHPGAWIVITAVLAILILPRITGAKSAGVGKAFKLSVASGIPASLGTVFMIGLSSLMEHSGMTQLIAGGLSRYVGSVYPLISPLVGTIGAFATGSNTNSNILFGPMQKSVADLLQISPILLLAAQTTGGALGSMIAPAKLAVGGSTNSMKGREGEVLRLTLPIGVASTLIIGILALLLN
jgi:lactate permease